MDKTIITLNLASRWKRLGGALIDGLTVLAIMIIIMLVSGVWQQTFSGQQLSSSQLTFFYFIQWAVFLGLNGYLLKNRGQTIGKVILKTRIVDLNGNVPNFGKLLVFRYLILGLIYQVPFFGELAALANALFIFGNERRLIHDYMAGTRVVDA